MDQKALQNLIDREAIRDLVLCYSRAIDRKDLGLLRDLYTDDATDTHGDSFDGGPDEYCAFIAPSHDRVIYFGHHVCNHMISVDGDTGCGEVYALSLALIPRGPGGSPVTDIRTVRYIDNYRRCPDGKWRFSKRFVTYDAVWPAMPFEGQVPLWDGADDPSYAECKAPMFQRGPRV